MTRPTYDDLVSTQQAWDTLLNAWKAGLFTNPYAVPQVADVGSLPTASDYDRCVAAVTDQNMLYMSDGTNWQPLGVLIDTTERACGYDEVNDRTIYKKSFTFTLANAGAQTQAHGISGLDVAKGDFMEVKATASDGTTVRQLPWYDGTDLLEVKVDATNITITSTKDETGTDAFVTLFYTK